MSSRTLAVGALLAISVGGATALGAQVDDEIAERLRDRIEAAGVPPTIEVAGTVAYAGTALRSFYVRRLYRPAWIADGRPTPLVDELLATLTETYREGLRPRDYHTEEIGSVLGAVRRSLRRAEPVSAARLTDLELLLTDAFLVCGSHLLAGRVDPETIHPDWSANRRGAEMDRVLDSALAAGAVGTALQALLPPQAGYARLRQVLQRYRAVAERGGWPRVSAGEPLQLGDSTERVAPLRRRLMLVDDLADSAARSGGAVFDSLLLHAVRRFQARLGLEPTGIVDSLTLRELNVSVFERIRQLELNLERWRWLPQDLGARHVLVNIAGFELEVVEGDSTVLAMRVVVGRSYRRTPVFSGNMTYLVLSPYWNVPNNLAVQDQLPLIKRDLQHLQRLGIRVFEGWGADAREIDPASVNWAEVTPQTFSYRLRQDPGPENALGQVKFMFPNRYNVYLHDTPSRGLFEQARRDFSSGCIRVQDPIGLALYLLRDQPAWNRAALMAAIATGRERTVALTHPIPVHLLYWTAWAERDGSVQFRSDIYGRDRLLDAALGQPPPETQ